MTAKAVAYISAPNLDPGGVIDEGAPLDTSTGVVIWPREGTNEAFERVTEHAFELLQQSHCYE
jgi:hypothetical protein